MLSGTPFHSRTAPLCQGHNWRRWAGYVVASSYGLTHDHEYQAIRSSAALIDVSPLYKYAIRGSDAERLLDRVLTRDVSRCNVGRVMYGPWCDETGKVIDDGTLQRLGDETFRLTSGEPNLRWLCESAQGLRATVEDDSDTIAALALQGPLARHVLGNACDSDLMDLDYFRLTFARIGGVPVTISRTGYTGDLGYEIWLEASAADTVWDTLVAAGRPFGLTPAGILALDVARIEAGLLLINVDYIPANRALIESRKSSPFELGLDWTVRLEKSHFIGRDALLAEWQRGPEWKLKGLELDWGSLERVYGEFGLPPQLPGVAWRTSVPVYVQGQQVGYATSGTWSPTLKKYIALAHLRTAHADTGTRVEMEVTAEHQRKRVSARVVEKPFFEPERKRA
ncbi:MAG: aminomethyl transferase family protein [Gemmatimonadetes bacterium]|uniref:Aminomethyl transferase family protein n=1 Tax=Candidatus Kutchimonas denitrificans TaxID=3056748 RepID=A0AAE5CCL5_9BACT|nr:aminomethyl transferase family protein [Gemmatimonadota bacterium]NIR75810.1 aminomethyl transferase family protein [Candidatus Kutchimonas denitrificans]NIS01978.1 aminomethyl transferase family protein [Gemmatimonadota bacterium]NIT67782.1 aminomethyl transferase family protein [Gemmatimonadota bacterium]NIU53769.1 aminomethyl transferase family protein [Gemmatimonadota bacterium]